MKTHQFRSSVRPFCSRLKGLLALTSCLCALNLQASLLFKWDQPPDPLTPTNIYWGWNEESMYDRVVVADDWACTNANPVIKIRWWGSFVGWKGTNLPPVPPIDLRVHFWTDVPANVDEPFSHPGTNVWEILRPFSAVPVKCVGQDYDPRDPGPGDPSSGNPWETCFLWELTLSTNEYFYQEQFKTEPTNIFWVSISARYSSNDVPQHPFGLKTLPRDTNSLAPDDAVRLLVPPLNSPTVGTTYFVGGGEPIFWPDPSNSWDIAFELCTTETDSGLLVKWEQLPDLSTNGIDVHATFDELSDPSCPGILLADDFMCTNQGPITNIVIWGSWFEDRLPENPQSGTADPTFVEFDLSIHADIPATTNEHSRPGPTLWRYHVPAGFFSHSIEAGDILEGFLNPVPCPDLTNFYTFPGDKVCHRYEFPIPALDAFFQEGTPSNPMVYWLDVQARLIPATPIQTPRPVFGWKTSETNWNDDATWAAGEDDAVGPPPGAWNELRYPAAHPLAGRSIDLAFRISTGRQTNTTQEVLKWSQPPYVADQLTNVYNGWNQESIYLGQETVADDWACTNGDSVTDIHWWGSFIGWSNIYAPPVLPDGFIFVIWDDVPADPPSTPSHPGQVLWTCESTNYNMEFAGWDIDPRQQECFVPETKYKFNVDLPDECVFYQDLYSPPGTTNIFWLTIAAIYTNQPNYPFGWETRPNPTNSVPPDDAVITFAPLIFAVGTPWTAGVPIEYPSGVSWNTSFQLTTCQPNLPAFTNLMFTNIVVTNIPGAQVVTMEWNVEPGAVYQVQCASNLCHTPPTVWIDVGPQIVSPANALALTNTWVTNRYYRICVPSTCP